MIASNTASMGRFNYVLLIALDSGRDGQACLVTNRNWCSEILRGHTEEVKSLYKRE